jgi:hypothetical protein
LPKGRSQRPEPVQLGSVGAFRLPQRSEGGPSSFGLTAAGKTVKSTDPLGRSANSRRVASPSVSAEQTIRHTVPPVRPGGRGGSRWPDALRRLPVTPAVAEAVQSIEPEIPQGPQVRQDGPGVALGVAPVQAEESTELLVRTAMA